MKKKIAIYMLFTLLLTMTACSEKSPRVVGEEINGASNKIIVKDMLDREIMLDKPTDKIALQWGGAGGAFMTMAALDKDHFQDRIVAIDTSLQETRKDMWDQFSKDVPELNEIPTIGWLESNEFSVESLISLKPEVFILPTGLKPNVDQTLEAQLEQAGIQIAYINYHSQKMEDHLRSTEIIGKLIGKEKEAQELNNFYKEQVEKVTKKLDSLNKEKPTVYFEVGMKGPKEYFKTHGKGFMFGELIEITKGDNIARNVENSQTSNPELVLGADPDIIIIAGSYWPNEPESMRLGFNCAPDHAQASLKAFTTRQGWDNLTAVKNRRMYALHNGVAREMYDFALIQHMAKIFYPEEFNDLDPEENFRTYYERFLPFQLNGTWFTQLQ